MVCESPTILIVDDEHLVCDLLRDELSSQGFLCSIAYCGKDALAELTAQHFDLVLLDIKLPGISGIEVLKKIRSNNPDTTTIMITGVNEIEVAVEVMKLGASDYIVKPFTLDKVNTTIKKVLEPNRYLLERRDSRVVPYVGDEEVDKPVTEESHGQMNAIAHGVEQRLESLFGYSKMVTQESIDIARRLGIPDKEIQSWAERRQILDSERNTIIRSSLNKLERNPLAQKIMGMAVPHRYAPKPDESRN